MKKLLLIGLIIVLVVFFSVPAFIFAEPGDNSTALGNIDGQYEMDPNMSTNDADSYADPPEESPGDNIEVYCLDQFIHYNEDSGAYEETDTDVSDELIANGVDPDNAEAVEIMATTATGSSDSMNQHVVWELISNDWLLDPSEQDVMDEILALAEEYNLNSVDSSSPYFGMTLEQFLEVKNINDVEVSLDDKAFIEADGTANNDFNATAIMENPLVPGVTDESKTVFWYILEGSYNVSFSQTDLMTTGESVMMDYEDTSSDVDNDGLTDTDSDHYGMATMPYYFYWWGDGFPEFEEMSVNIGACVDIDGDGSIDKEKGEDLDSFNTNANVVKTIENPDWNEGSLDQGPYNSEHMVEVKKDGENNPIINPDSKVPEVETYIPNNLDIDYYNAGKMIVAEEEVFQPFVIESYSEPCDSTQKLYTRWLDFTVNKTDSSNDDPVEGAVYSLTYNSGRTSPNSYPYENYFEQTTDASGNAVFTGLPWAIYSLIEESAPSGYYLDTNVYFVKVAGMYGGDPNDPIPGETDENELGLIYVQNDPKTPPPPPPPPETPPTTTIGVAGIIEVAGLAFTGIPPVIPIAGVGTMIGGLGLLITSLVIRKRKK